MLLAPVPMAVIANLALRENLARLVTLAFVGAMGAGTLVLTGLDLLPGSAAVLTAPSAAAQVAAGVLVCALLAPQVRRVVARALPIDPENPVHLLALAFTVLMFANGVASAAANLVAQEAGTAQPLSRWDLILGELPFLLAAFAGVGLVLRRSGGASLRRLGLTLPAWWHIVLAIAAAGLFFGLSTGLDALGQVLTPATSRDVNSVTQRIFGQLTQDIGGVATIALVAGICEEVLFRGALQPRAGLIWASLVFASVHTQYGLSFDELAVVLLAVGLGLIRRFLNTTSSIVCHATYNTMAGIGLARAVVPWAIAAEAVLLALLGLALALQPRPARRPAS